MRALAVARGYDMSECYAYSDSETDVPMLSAVGHPHAVNPDKVLRRMATDHSWPVLQFRRPVELKEHARWSSSRSRAGAMAAAAGAVGAGFVSWQLRRVRHRVAG
jgi:hypothetical protein